MTRWLLVLIHMALGGSAVWAGRAFVRDPSGSQLAMDPEWLDGSPFPDYRVPGFFLAVVIGGANLVAALSLLCGHRLAPRASFVTGILLVGWIAVQTAIIGLRHWTQAFWWALFLLVAVLGGRLARSEPR